MKFDNTYDKLPAEFFSEAAPNKFTSPKLLKFNKGLAKELNLSLESESEESLADIFSGQKILEGSHPIAMVYAAHQFGNFVPRLGDGRAMLLGEILDLKGKRVDVQLKGAGPTEYSRNGDGFSALGPVIREYIVSEAMHHLGVPTTRALAAVATRDDVYREIVQPGGVFTRVAASHIRIGTFQYFGAKRDVKGLETLLDYSINRHYPEIQSAIKESDGSLSSAVLFLRKVIIAQVSLVTKWMSLGFIHGVMNTDNMTVSGETIDYGPCAFMDTFKSDQVYSYIDRNGRYSYENQRAIVAWNLSRLADCLIPLVDPNQDKAIELLNAELKATNDLFIDEWQRRMAEKLGLTITPATKSEDMALIVLWLELLEKEKLDFTLSFRTLPDLLEANVDQQNSLFNPTSDFNKFELMWKERLKNEPLGIAAIKEKMNSLNPLYIPRNHQVEKAIQGAIKGDLTVFNEMNQVLSNPYAHQPDLDFYKQAPLPNEEIEATFCGT